MRKKQHSRRKHMTSQEKEMTTGQGQDEASVRALGDNFAKAFVQKNAEQRASLFAENGTFVTTRTRRSSQGDCSGRDRGWNGSAKGWCGSYYVWQHDRRFSPARAEATRITFAIHV